MLEQEGIQQFSTHGDANTLVAEQFNRMLKGRMYRYLTAANTLLYDDVLPALVNGHDRNQHRSIGIQYNTIQYHTYLIAASHRGFSRPMKHNERNDRTQKQLLRIPTGRRQTSWLFTSAAEKLNQGLPGTNSTSGQNGF